MLERQTEYSREFLFQSLYQPYSRQRIRSWTEEECHDECMREANLDSVDNAL
jgi:hypothetical protein